MLDDNMRRLEGRRGLVIGIANEHSIAWGCARAFRAFGAELAMTYLNDKAKPFVEPLARDLGAPLFLPLDVALVRQLSAAARVEATMVIEGRKRDPGCAGLDLFLAEAEVEIVPVTLG